MEAVLKFVAYNSFCSTFAMSNYYRRFCKPHQRMLLGEFVTRTTWQKKQLQVIEAVLKFVV